MDMDELDRIVKCTDETVAEGSAFIKQAGAIEPKDGERADELVEFEEKQEPFAKKLALMKSITYPKLRDRVEKVKGRVDTLDSGKPNPRDVQEIDEEQDGLEGEMEEALEGARTMLKEAGEARGESEDLKKKYTEKE